MKKQFQYEMKRGNLAELRATYLKAKLLFMKRPDITSLTHLWRCFGNCEPYWSEKEWEEERMFMAQVTDKITG